MRWAAERKSLDIEMRECEKHRYGKRPKKAQIYIIYTKSITRTSDSCNHCMKSLHRCQCVKSKAKECH